MAVYYAWQKRVWEAAGKCNAEESDRTVNCCLWVHGKRTFSLFPGGQPAELKTNRNNAFRASFLVYPSIGVCLLFQLSRMWMHWNNCNLWSLRRKVRFTLSNNSPPVQSVSLTDSLPANVNQRRIWKRILEMENRSNSDGTWSDEFSASFHYFLSNDFFLIF